LGLGLVNPLDLDASRGLERLEDGNKLFVLGGRQAAVALDKPLALHDAVDVRLDLLELLVVTGLSSIANAALELSEEVGGVRRGLRLEMGRQGGLVGSLVGWTVWDRDERVWLRSAHMTMI
jgi:hypothetical protein